MIHSYLTLVSGKKAFFGKISAFFLVLATGASMAQVAPAWTARYNGPGNGYDQGKAIAIDAAGNSYVTGSSSNGTSYDYVTVKYGPSGNQIWEARYNGTGNSYDYPSDIKVDAAGNSYVTGYATDLVNGYDFVTVKYNSAGVQQWVATYNGTSNGFDYAYGLALDAAGNVYVVGSAAMNTWYTDITTIKYDNNGVQQWVKWYGQSTQSDQGKSIGLDAAGNVYVTGSAVISGTYTDYATIKYDNSGNQQWVMTFDGLAAKGDYANSIAVDAAGNSYVTGYATTSGFYYDYCTIKYNTGGTQQWQKYYNGTAATYDNATMVKADGSGNCYVTGYSSGTGTGYDYATVKYDGSGNQVWVQRYNGLGNSTDYGYALDVDAAGDAYVTGYSAGTGFNYDYATIKYTTAGIQSWVKLFNGPGNSYDYGYAVAVNSTGCYVTGNANMGSDTDYGTVKYDLNGNFQWVAYYNGPGIGADQSKAITTDAAGNVYVTGASTRGTADKNYATVKYDKNGVQQWAQVFNGTGNKDDEGRAIAVDGSGNVYVTGVTVGTALNNDITTIKYNSAGVQQWASVFNGTANNADEGKDLVVDAAGNVYVTGYSTGSTTLYDCVTIKYNASGAQQWAKTFNGTGNSYDDASAIALDPSNNIYITGYTDNGTDQDYVIIKYDGSGNQLWKSVYNGTGNAGDYARALVCDANAAYVTGRSQGLSSNYDFATVKFASSGGAQQWASRYNGAANGLDDGKSLAIDAAGNVFVTGISPGATSGTDFATVKYNASGAQQWVQRYNGTANNTDGARDITVDANGNIFVTGYSYKTATDYDYATIQYNTQGVQQWVTLYNGTGNGIDDASALTVDANGSLYVTGASPDVVTNDDYLTIKYCIANAGRDTTICNGSGIVINANGGGTYTWSPSTGLSCSNCASPTASPTVTTTYTVTVTSSSGCNTTDDVKVTVKPAPTVNAGADVTICAGGNTTLSGSATGISYTWSPAVGLSNPFILNPTAYPTITTTYTLKTIGSNGCVVTDSLVITVNPLPNATATATKTTVCEGDSTVLNGGGGGTYLWIPSTGLTCSTCSSTVAKPTVTTTYTLQVTGAGNCTKNVTLTININNKPLAFAGPDLNVCTGSSTTITATGVGTNTYQWAPSSGLSCTTCQSTSANPTVTTTYTLTVTTPSGCINYDTIKVSVSASPNANAGPNQTKCGSATVQLTATGGTSYSWAPATGLSCTNCPNPVANPASTTTYTVTVSDINGCTAQSTVMVTCVPAATVPTISQNFNVLTSSSATSYQWYLNGFLISGAVNQNYTISQNGNYTVVITDANGCTATSTIFTVTNIGIDEAVVEGSFKLFPNPNDGRFELSFTVPSGGNYIIEILNALGQVVQTEKLDDLANKYSGHFDISDKGKGVYLLTIRNSDNHTYVNRVMVY